MISEYFSRWTIAHLRDLKRCGQPAKAVLIIGGPTWMGYGEPRYAVWYGDQVVTSFPRRHDAVSFRNSIWDEL